MTEGEGKLCFRRQGDRETGRQGDRETGRTELTGYPSIDKPWLRHYSEESLEAALPSGSMYDYMLESVKNVKHKYVLNYFGRSISHNEFFGKIDKVAAALSAQGAVKGDVISLCVLTMPENYYLLYGANKLGVICNYLAVNNTPREMRKKLVSTGSKLVFTVDIALNAVREATEGLNVKIVVIPLRQSMPWYLSLLVGLKSPKSKHNSQTMWNDFLRLSDTCGGKIVPDHDEDSASIIVYTSGTTGESKGVLHTNKSANMIAHYYKNLGKLMPFNAGEKSLNILPPFVAYGVFVGTHMPVCAEQYVYLGADPNPESVASLFAKCKPNHFSGSPAHIDALLNNPDIQKMNLVFLKTIAYGGDIVASGWDDKVNEFLQSHGCRNKVIAGYGMTEMAGTFCTAMHSLNTMIPFSRNNAKVIDMESGEELSYEQEGELLLSGPSMMKGYYKDDEHTRKTIMETEGVRWLKTGDLAAISETGEIKITGRIKRLYWSLGKDGMAYRVSVN